MCARARVHHNSWCYRHTLTVEGAKEPDLKATDGGQTVTDAGLRVTGAAGGNWRRFTRAITRGAP